MVMLVDRWKELTKLVIVTIFNTNNSLNIANVHADSSGLQIIVSSYTQY